MKPEKSQSRASMSKSFQKLDSSTKLSEVEEKSAYNNTNGLPYSKIAIQFFSTPVALIEDKDIEILTPGVTRIKEDKQDIADTEITMKINQEIMRKSDAMSPKKTNHIRARSNSALKDRYRTIHTSPNKMMKVKRTANGLNGCLTDRIPVLNPMMDKSSIVAPLSQYSSDMSQLMMKETLKPSQVSNFGNMIKPLATLQIDKEKENYCGESPTKSFDT